MSHLPLTLWLLSVVAAPGTRSLAEPISIHSPLAPPTWALQQRELLCAQASACEEFYGKYFDERGYLLCVERWGGNDGPDDAIENVHNWPLLYALGAPPRVWQLYQEAWEGHLRQYTAAKTEEVPFARDGMYYKEFPVMMDWVHNGEGLAGFFQQGLADPENAAYEQRLRRFTGFYMNEDPGAPNYDAQHKLIRSLFNGSRGPLLRKATALDWAGDPLEVQNRFQPRHGEESYEQMLEHFQDYNDILGDHPQNLVATSLATNAFLLTGEPKYKRWLLEYVDAWRQRAADNDGILPSNIGLDGRIGGATDGKWYGGVYGWGFTVRVPGTDQFANRNTVALGQIGFANAFLLTGDRKYLDVWRNMIEAINRQAQVIDGRKMYPTMHGDQGWYGWQETPWQLGAQELAYWSMEPHDRQRVSQNAWWKFLAGQDPEYPERVLSRDFTTVRDKVAQMRSDLTTPDTRLADDPLPFNPATTRNLCNLMLGGLEPGIRGQMLHARLRYFDPVRRRSGPPPDVAALVQRMTDEETVVTLVNISPTQPRTLIVQAGAYGEHQCQSVILDEREYRVEAPSFTVQLAPGAGAEVTVHMQRYANQPRHAWPW